ncbi:MAG: helix-turn-helix transcriptional regulator, partial [Clostridia bacterium]|nr:helix-turn-helix transcriptional regulator [Clostridia bacterium]
ITASNQRNLVKRGEFFIINRSEAHSLVRTDSANMLLVLQFSPNFCRDYYPQLSRYRILQHHVVQSMNPRLYDELLINFEYMFKCMGDKKEGYQLALMASLNRIASAIVQYGEYENLSSEKKSSEEKMRLRLAGIIDYIQKNYTHNISLAELAQRENLDMTYLSHFIRNKLGVTFREYVNRLRLERAVDLVATTNMRMIDICIDCGYSDYRYLNKAFVQEFNMTPAQVRESGIGARPAFLMRSVEENDGNEHKYANLGAVHEWVCRELEGRFAELEQP